MPTTAPARPSSSAANATGPPRSGATPPTSSSRSPCSAGPTASTSGTPPPFSSTKRCTVARVGGVPRPNLVLVMPDQLRQDATSTFAPAGGADTPHLDALAARGTRFTQAFSQHSVCGPSRASIFTGWYPHVAGHRTLDHLLKPHEPNLLRLAKDAGYHVAWAGLRGDTFSPGVPKASTDFAGSLVPPRHRRWPSAPDPVSTWPRLAAANAWYGGRRTARAGDPDTDVVDL